MMSQGAWDWLSAAQEPDGGRHAASWGHGTSVTARLAPLGTEAPRIGCRQILEWNLRPVFRWRERALHGKPPAFFGIPALKSASIRRGVLLFSRLCADSEWESRLGAGAGLQLGRNDSLGSAGPPAEPPGYGSGCWLTSRFRPALPFF